VAEGAGGVDIRLGAGKNFLPAQWQPGNTLGNGLIRNFGSLMGKDIRLVHAGHDVFRVDTPAPRVFRQRMGGANGHAVCDLAGPHHQRTFEDAGKAAGVVDLVGEITSSGGHDIGSGCLGGMRIDLRNRIGAGEDDGLFRHPADPLGFYGMRPGGGKGDEHVSPRHRLVHVAQAFGIADLRQTPLPVFVRITGQVFPAGVQRSLAVEHDQVGGIKPRLQQDAGDRGVGRSGAKKHRANLPDLLSSQLERVQQPRQSNAGGALGIVVPHRDAAAFAQFVQHPVAIWLGDVLQIHRAHAGSQHSDKIYQPGGIRLAVLPPVVHAEGEGVEST